eukprot:TRINITY_DN10164_c0_g1_i5.p1 TRINITY_DN10164_c0_g1~~TRINITY_DN10164_c0_g1_i5.p1  ORF type:complete len:266 (-),score=45.07 TRINITY_DN10164_c0_g1_i5:414-1211(-)
MSDPAEAEEDTEPAEPQQKRQRTEQQPCEVGLVFDTRMTLHAREPGGPAPFKLKTGEALEEAPERILRVRRGLELAGLIERCTMVPSREVTMHEACAVHSQEHWNDVEALPSLSAEDRCKRTEEADTVYFNQHTSLAARLAAGSTLELCSNIAMGSMLRGFAIVRPPGHHAEHSQCRGFCLLNNVAIAAKFALTRQSVNRVLILDVDQCYLVFGLRIGLSSMCIMGRQPNRALRTRQRCSTFPFIATTEGGSTLVARLEDTRKSV